MNKIALLEDLKNVLENQFSGIIDQIILFGSQAKGNAGFNSDYDILIILKNDYDWRTENKILDLCYEIDLKYDIVTDIKIISVSELNSYQGKQPFIIEALENGVAI